MVIYHNFIVLGGIFSGNTLFKPYKLAYLIHGPSVYIKGYHLFQKDIILFSEI